MIGDDIVVEVVAVSGSSVRIGIAAPKSIPVYREEIYTAVKAENTAAAAAAQAATDQLSEAPAPAETRSGSHPPGRS